MPQTYELALTGFRFPAALPPRKANFRLVADVRYVNGRGEHATEHSVLPDLDRWWECDPGRRNRPEYVRGPDEGPVGTLDMARVDEWDRLVLLVRGDGIHSIQFRVFDVNRRDAWDRIRRWLGDVVGGLLGRARTAVPESAGTLSDALGTASVDLESALVARLAGGGGWLCRGSTLLSGPGEYVVEAEGEHGSYEVGVRLTIT